MKPLIKGKLYDGASLRCIHRMTTGLRVKGYRPKL